VTLMVELCYPRPPVLDGQAILAAARVLHPGVEWMNEDATEGPMMFAFPDLAHTYADGVNAPLGVALLPGSQAIAGDPERYDTSQTWDWDEASAALQSSPHTVLVSELMGRVHPPKQRVEAFGAIVDVLIALTEPAATWWPFSGRAMAPGDAVVSTLGGLVNVRMFNDADAPGNLLMDTIGLHALGLPDVEMYFSGLDPKRIAGLLYDVAHYLVDGNEIEDGASVVQSRLEPDRAVLRLDPPTA
jgi:hypothetical protein